MVYRYIGSKQLNSKKLGFIVLIDNLKNNNELFLNKQLTEDTKSLQNFNCLLIQSLKQSTISSVNVLAMMPTAYF